MVEPPVQELLREFFQKEVRTIGGADIVAVYLFGSVARNQATDRSDVDIGFLLARDPVPSLDATGQVLAAQLVPVVRREVDPVVLNRAPADLVHRVLRDGVLVYDRDPAARIAFEVYKRNEYFDLMPILHEYRRGKMTV